MTIEELKQALEAATPVGWEIKRACNGEIIGVVERFGRTILEPDHDDLVGWKVSFDNPSDARLIVEAVNNLPALLKVADAAKDLPYLYDQASADPYNVGYSQVSDEIELLRKALEELNND